MGTLRLARARNKFETLGATRLQIRLMEKPPWRQEKFIEKLSHSHAGYEVITDLLVKQIGWDILSKERLLGIYQTAQLKWIIAKTIIATGKLSKDEMIGLLFAPDFKQDVIGIAGLIVKKLQLDGTSREELCKIPDKINAEFEKSMTGEANGKFSLVSESFHIALGRAKLLPGQ